MTLRLKTHTVNKSWLTTNHAFWKCWILLVRVSISIQCQNIFQKKLRRSRLRIKKNIYIPVEEYTALRDQWIRDGEGFLLVYSITSRSTFERIERFRDQIFRVKDVDNVPMMLVGNKCDKVTDREVTREEGYAMAKRLGCDFIETSAKTCVNVERSFYQVVKIIRAQREGLNTSPKNKSKKEKRSKCLIL